MRISAPGCPPTNRWRCCALWTEPVVTFDGRWHQIDAAGSDPLPVQRPIPIWFGGVPRASAMGGSRWDCRTTSDVPC